MNTNDPLDCIVYPRTARHTDPCAVPRTSGRAGGQRPDQYSKKALRTRSWTRTTPSRRLPPRWPVYRTMRLDQPER